MLPGHLARKPKILKLNWFVPLPLIAKLAIYPHLQILGLASNQKVILPICRRLLFLSRSSPLLQDLNLFLRIELVLLNVRHNVRCYLVKLGLRGLPQVTHVTKTPAHILHVEVCYRCAELLLHRCDYILSNLTRLCARAKLFIFLFAPHGQERCQVSLVLDIRERTASQVL